MPYASIEKRREYQRKWRKEHPDLNRKYKNKHYAEKIKPKKEMIREVKRLLKLDKIATNIEKIEGVKYENQ